MSGRRLEEYKSFKSVGGREEGGGGGKSDKTAFGNESREKKPGEMEGRWKASGDGACNLNVQTRAFAVN